MKRFFNKIFDFFGSPYVLWLSWFAILFFVLIIFAFTSHASSDQDYFPILQNKNGHFTDDVVSTLANYYDDENNYLVIYYYDYNYRVFVFPKSDYQDNLGQLCGEKYNNLYQFSLYQLGTLHPTVYQCQIVYGTVYSNIVASGNSSYGYFYGLESSNYNTSIDYISNLKIWTTNNSTKKLVIQYDEQPIYTDPDNDTYPNNFDKPNLDDYFKPDNAPGFDGSTVEKAVESLYTLLKWYLQDPNCLPGLFQYFIDNTNWAIQKVINNLRNVITEVQEAVEDFSDTVSGYLDDIKDYFDYLIEPLDLQEVESALSSSATYSLFTTAGSFKSTFQNYFDSINAPSTLSFHIPYTILTHSGYIDFDFGWYSNIRDSVLPWIVGFLYAGFGLAFFRTIPSIIHGVSGILQKGG